MTIGQLGEVQALIPIILKGLWFEIFYMKLRKITMKINLCLI